MFTINTNTGYVVGINNTHLCVVTSFDVAHAKTFKTRGQAERYLNKNADCGYGLNSATASVVAL